MTPFFQLDPKIESASAAALQQVAPRFTEIDEVTEYNQLKVLPCSSSESSPTICSRLRRPSRTLPRPASSFSSSIFCAMLCYAMCTKVHVFVVFGLLFLKLRFLPQSPVLD